MAELTPLEVIQRATGHAVDKRPCAACTACCTIQAVRELGKPYYTPCTKLCKVGVGCSVYADRPPTCRTFECGWRMGLVPAIAGTDGTISDVHSRPDRLGLLFDMDSNEHGDWLDVYEAWPGVFQRVPIDIVEAIVHKLGKSTISGVRFFPYGSKIGISFPAGADYPAGQDLEGKPRGFVTKDDWHLLYVEAQPPNTSDGGQI